jgi:hypothetical protein
MLLAFEKIKMLLAKQSKSARLAHSAERVTVMYPIGYRRNHKAVGSIPTLGDIARVAQWKRVRLLI